MSSIQPRVTIDSPEAAPPVRTDELDAARLQPWLEGHVPGFRGPLEVRRFAGGQSNPTYQLATPTRRFVLRRKPAGELLRSAHAVDREFRVIRALHKAGFPTPRPHAICNDDSVIGSMFYVMDMVDGRILWNARLPDFQPVERAAIYDAQIDVLARLHSLEPDAVGLGDYGAPGNYFSRQVGRWTKQYRASETRTIPEMDRLVEWLPRRVPPDTPARVVHGDFRLDNMVLDAAQPRVIALLDWELSTLGDPMADLTYFLMQWVMPPGERNSLAGLDLPGLGIPTIEQAVARYADLTGRGPAVSMEWYFAYNLFRLAAILQGIVGRHEAGNASSPKAAQAAGRVGPLAVAAWAQALKAGA